MVTTFYYWDISLKAHLLLNVAACLNSEDESTQRTQHVNSRLVPMRKARVSQTIVCLNISQMILLLKKLTIKHRGTVVILFIRLSAYILLIG